MIRSYEIAMAANSKQRIEKIICASEQLIISALTQLFVLIYTIGDIIQQTITYQGPKPSI